MLLLLLLPLLLLLLLLLFKTERPTQIAQPPRTRRGSLGGLGAKWNRRSGVPRVVCLAIISVCFEVMLLIPAALRLLRTLPQQTMPNPTRIATSAPD